MECVFNKASQKPMDRNAYCKELIEQHKNLMSIVDKESPPIKIRGRLVSSERRGGAREAVFAVSNTSRTTKLASLVEGRVFFKGGSGTITDAYDDKLVLAVSRAFPDDTAEMEISANYNNEILLKAAENFASSTKAVHPALFNNAAFNKEDAILNGAKIDFDFPKDMKIFNNKLNQSQACAVAFSLREEPFKILGPPGTGKTETIVEIISQKLAQKKKVLVCGPSNISVDNILARFEKSKYNQECDTPFYRLGSAVKGLVQYNLEARADESVSFMDSERTEVKGKGSGEVREFYKDRADRKNQFIRELKKRCPLVFATLFSSLKENCFFDICIVDEACQASCLECFMGVVKAKTFILVGDPNQLCPMGHSLYNLVNIPTVVLKEQYRMHGELMAFSNNHFYAGEIISNKPDDFLFFNESKILFIDTAYFDYSEKTVGTSRMNNEEARLVAEVAEFLLSQAQDTSACSVGVITPYTAQVLAIRELIGGLPGCSVDTVDGFQGQEKDFIILSLVRSNENLEYGFLSDQKRMNVALTRCKRGMVVVGDSENFKKSKFFKQLFGFLNKSAYVVDPVTFREMI